METSNLKTSNLKTASNSPTVTRLAAITGGVRSLWASGLSATAPDRENLVCELIDLELAVERLSLRTSRQLDWPEDHQQTQSFSEKFVSLERRWHEAAARSFGPDARVTEVTEVTEQYEDPVRGSASQRTLEDRTS